MSKYPESEKLRSPDVGTLRRFVEWLTEEREKPIPDDFEREQDGA